jgi:rhodanese-related sulfurtransferase
MTKPWTLATAALLSLSVTACDKKVDAEQGAPGAEQKTAAGPKASDDPHAKFANLSVDDVDKLVADKKCVPIDANGAETREKYGTLPGAVLLTGFEDFKTSELPADKGAKLVFYCGGEKCTAAPKAAQVAQQAGYTDVNVMRAGIRG